MAGPAHLGDRAESSYDRLLAEIRSGTNRLERRMDLLEQQMKLLEQRLEQKFEERADQSDELLARRLAQQGFWLAGVIIGTAAVMAALAATGVF